MTHTHVPLQTLATEDERERKRMYGNHERRERRHSNRVTHMYHYRCYWGWEREKGVIVTEWLTCTITDATEDERERKRSHSNRVTHTHTHVPLQTLLRMRERERRHSNRVTHTHTHIPLQTRPRASRTSHLCWKEEVVDSRMFRNISLKNTCRRQEIRHCLMCELTYYVRHSVLHIPP